MASAGACIAGQSSNVNKRVLFCFVCAWLYRPPCAQRWPHQCRRRRVRNSLPDERLWRYRCERSSQLCNRTLLGVLKRPPASFTRADEHVNHPPCRSFATGNGKPVIIATPEGAGIEGMSLWGSECHAYGSLACYRGSTLAFQQRHGSLPACHRSAFCAAGCCGARPKGC